MNNQDILKSFITKCKNNLSENPDVVESLKHAGINESFIFENLNPGYSDKNVYKGIGTNENLLNRLNDIGLYKNKNIIFQNYITIPIYNENKIIQNIIFLNPDTTKKNNLSFLNNEGIFNSTHLKNTDNVILTTNPIHTLLLIQANYHNTTFIYGDHKKYLDFFKTHSINKCILTFDGKATFVYKLEKNNINVHRTNIDFKNKNTFSNLDKILDSSTDQNNNPTTCYTKIENGFLFTFPHMTYRVIGNFYNQIMSLKVYIKACKNDEVFINSIDLYKNRERQKFIFSLMDKFNLRDHICLENDLNKIIKIIENYKEKNKNTNDSEFTKQISILTQTEEKKALDILTGSNLIKDHVIPDTEKMGLVGEQINKNICYHAIISRLWRTPINICTISMYGQGKTFLHDTMHRFVPDEDLKEYSRITKNDLYYHEGENAFIGKVLSVDEAEGISNSLYSIRTLISKGYLSISYPAIDPVTKRMRSAENKVFGRPSIFITCTNDEKLDEETLNRFAVCTTDSSNEQRFRIKQRQLFEMTLEGLKQKRMEEKIIKKHKNILRFIKKVEVLFPESWSSKLKKIENGEYSVRNNLCYLGFIASSAIKDQYNRKQYILDDEFGKFNYVEITKNDIRFANEIMRELFGKTVKDLKPPQKVFLEKIQNYVKHKAENKINMTDFPFYEDEIRRGTNLSYWQVNRYLNELIKLEYITVHSKGKHNKQKYKLEISEIKDQSEKYLTGLIDPDIL